MQSIAMAFDMLDLPRRYELTMNINTCSVESYSEG